MRIGIIGSRRRTATTDFISLLKQFKLIYKEGDSIVSGGCPIGGDAFAEKIAQDYGISITIHYPNKKLHGLPAAFFIRNTLVAEDSNIILAIVSADRTGGTEDTIKKAIALGKQIIYV